MREQPKGTLSLFQSTDPNTGKVNIMPFNPSHYPKISVIGTPNSCSNLLLEILMEMIGLLVLLLLKRLLQELMVRVILFIKIKPLLKNIRYVPNACCPSIDEWLCYLEFKNL